MILGIGVTTALIIPTEGKMHFNVGWVRCVWAGENKFISSNTIKFSKILFDIYIETNSLLSFSHPKYTQPNRNTLRILQISIYRDGKIYLR